MADAGVRRRRGGFRRRQTERLPQVVAVQAHDLVPDLDEVGRTAPSSSPTARRSAHRLPLLMVPVPRDADDPDADEVRDSGTRNLAQVPLVSSTTASLPGVGDAGAAVVLPGSSGAPHGAAAPARRKAGRMTVSTSAKPSAS